MRRQLLLYLTLLTFVGSLLFIIFSNTNIEHYFINQNVDQLRCEVFLGILTVQAHTSLRKFIRNSWIKDLPRNVCYKFLYDIPEYIPNLEKFDGLSIDATYEGKGLRFGEKLYKFYSHVINSSSLRNVKYVVKMDDDVVLCPKQLFSYLSKKINLKSYVGWFHNMNTWKSKVDYDHRSDEMFVLLGRDLIDRIVSQPYCKHETKEQCDSLGQLYDTNFGGTSLATWLSTMNDVDAIPMNARFQHTYSKKGLKAEHRLLFHPSKSPEKGHRIYSSCKKIRL